MSQENDHDFRDQHKILVLEMLTNPCEGLVTKILLHSVTNVDFGRSKKTPNFRFGKSDRKLIHFATSNIHGEIWM